MDKETIKNRIDFDNIQEISIEDIKGVSSTTINYDYLVDFEGNYIIALTPLEVKLIEKNKEQDSNIKELESRILELEKK